MNRPDISIIVANWNGELFLREALRTILQSAKASGKIFEIIVVDDASTDGSKTLIRQEFPEVILLDNPQNIGFARTSNRGAWEASGRVLIMLNNDMTIPTDFIFQLSSAFFEKADPLKPLFAVGAKTIEETTSIPNQLCMTAGWRRGGIGSVWSDPQERREVTYAQGGSAAYDRNLFIRLGGFNPVFHPGYWEDFDLTYRACKAGWRVLYEPKAVAVHRGKASMSRIMNQRKLEQIIERNRLWFNWLNLDDPLLICRHIVAIPWICLRDLVTKKEMTGLAAFIRALGGLRKILHARRQRKINDPPRAKKDRELIYRHFGSSS